MPLASFLLVGMLFGNHGLKAALAGAPAGEATHDWPQFLGPSRDGRSTETGLNLNWKSRPPKVLWKIPVGNGFSSFAVVGDRLYTMMRRGQRDFVVCLQVRDGKECWAYDAAPTYIDKQKQGAGPRSTPTFHNGKLYCLLPMGELVCLNAEDGRRIWEKNIFTASGAKNPAGAWFYWGVSLSPLVEGDLVIVQPGGDRNRSVLALQKDTGATVWSVGGDPPGYASPIAITAAGRRQIVCPTGRSVLGIDPAKGQVLWRYAFGNQFNATAATPVWTGDLLLVSAAYGVGSAALRIRQDQGKTVAHEKWKTRKDLQNLFATSVIQDGHIFGCHGDLSAFQVRCVDLKTGKMIWTQRVSGRSALLAVQGHLLEVDERGTLRLLEANSERYVAKAELPDLLAYKTWAAPALSNGRLYLRDDRHALCLDLRRQ
jgi:outer membrane protein assembly factor BamB